MTGFYEDWTKYYKVIMFNKSDVLRQLQHIKMYTVQTYHLLELKAVLSSSTWLLDFVEVSLCKKTKNKLSSIFFFNLIYNAESMLNVVSLAIMLSIWACKTYHCSFLIGSYLLPGHILYSKCFINWLYKQTFSLNTGGYRVYSKPVRIQKKWFQQELFIILFVICLVRHAKSEDTIWILSNSVARIFDEMDGYSNQNSNPGFYLMR